MTRIPLPARRRNFSETVEFRGQPIAVTVGFDDAAMPREVFATGPKEGSDMAHTLSDACIVISVALQHGIPPDALARSLGTVPGWDGDQPASPLGAILGVLMQDEPR